MNILETLKEKALILKFKISAFKFKKD